MKRTIALMLVLIAVLSLFGCGKAKDPETETGPKTVALGKDSTQYIKIAYRAGDVKQKIEKKGDNDVRTGTCPLDIKVLPTDAQTTITGVSVVVAMNKDSLWICDQQEINLSSDGNGGWIGSTVLHAISLTPAQVLEAPTSKEFEVEVVSLEGTHTEP